jgi:hypothetical protein
MKLTKVKILLIRMGSDSGVLNLVLLAFWKLSIIQYSKMKHNIPGPVSVPPLR